MGNESNTQVLSGVFRAARAARLACGRFVTGCADLPEIRPDRRGIRLASFARWDAPHVRVGQLSEETAV